MNEIEQREAPRRNPLLWPVRFLLHWTIKLIVLFLMGIRAVLRPKPVRFGIVVLILLGVVGWNFAGPTLSPKSVPAAQPDQPAQSQASYSAASVSGPVSVPATERLERPPAVEQYLKAQQNFDANGMWSVISDDLKQQLASNNTTLNDLQSELEAAKQAGRHYGKAIYVGGVALGDGTDAYFYVLTVDTSSGQQQIPYTYVVDSSGKIASIQ